MASLYSPDESFSTAFVARSTWNIFSIQNQHHSISVLLLTTITAIRYNDWQNSPSKVNYLQLSVKHLGKGSVQDPHMDDQKSLQTPSCDPDLVAIVHRANFCTHQIFQIRMVTKMSYYIEIHKGTR